MRKFRGYTDIIFTRVRTPSAKYTALPFCIESFSHFCASENYSAERADLNCYIVLYTIKGEGILQYLGNEYKIGENQVIFIDCSKHHIYKSAPGKQWEFYFMLIYGDGVKAYYDILFSERYYVLEYFECNIIKKFMDSLLFLDRQNLQQFELLACHKIDDLLIELILLNSETSNSTFAKALDYVEKNYDKKISVDDLASECNMSKYHFIRKFKSIYAETPHQYITRIRVNKAKSLLSMPDYSIDEIALQLGFDYTTTFIRAFKSITGMTPNKYRNSNLHTIIEKE